MAESETAPRDSYTVGPTKRGHRLEVTQWSNSLYLSVLTEVMILPSADSFNASAGQVGVVTGATRSEADRFVAHALGFFQDPELVELGLAAVAKMHSALKPPAKPTPSTPPPTRGAN